MAKILVTLDGKRSELVLNFPYSEQTTAVLKTVYGRRFDSETKTWRVPLAALEDLINTFGCRLEFSTPYKQIVAAMNQVIPIMGAVDLRVLDVMKIKPYDYQLLGGTAFLPEVKCGILADVPGLGKTIQTFAGFASLFLRGQVTRCLVFCKKSLKSQWLSELEKFTPYTGIKIYGDAVKRERLYQEALDPKYNFIFVNYDFLQHDIKYLKMQEEKYLKRLKEKGLNPEECEPYHGVHDLWWLHQIVRSCQIIALDEAQKIKNNTKIHSNMLKLTFSTSKKDPFDPPEYRWALTGTPIENSPSDLYNICKFINPQIFGQNPKPFQSRYYTDRFHSEVDLARLEDLKLRIAPFMLRRTQEAVEREFPKCFIENIKLDMSDEQAEIHEMLRDATSKLVNDLKDETIPGNASVIGTFALLLQVADSPHLLGVSESLLGQKIYHKKVSGKKMEVPKIEWVCDYLEARKAFYPEAKTLIFTRSDDMAFMVQDALSEIFKPSEILIYKGGLNEKEQDEIKAAFWGDAKVLIATEAGSEGLNLQCADLEINIDLPYNPSRLSQRIGRINRDGSKFSHVRIINLISKDSIDERILDIIYYKQGFIDKVIEGNVFDMKLTKTLLSKLLEGDSECKKETG